MNTFCAQRKQNIIFIQLLLLLRDTFCKRVHEFTSKARRKHAVNPVTCWRRGQRTPRYVDVIRSRRLRRASSEACLRHALLVNSWTRLQKVSRRRRKSWIKLIFCFLCAQKVFSWLRKITVDRLMSHGLLCRSSWYFSGPWSCKDPCCLWEGQRALRFKLNYLNLCSDDERRSYGFGTPSGWVIND